MAVNANQEQSAKTAALRYASAFGDDWDRENGFQDGFNAGAQWQRGQGDSLVRDTLSALSAALQLIDNLDFEYSPITAKQIKAWHRVIDTAENRA